MKLRIFLFCLCCNYMSYAQEFRVGLQQGLGFDMRASQDSLFLSKQHLISQLQMGYHYGKLGVISHVSYGRQTSTDDRFDERIPNLGVPDSNTELLGNTVQTIQATLGVELCIPIIPRKLCAAVYTTYGVNVASSDSLRVIANGVTRYRTEVNPDENITGCWQSGLALQYRIGRRVQLRWQNEYSRYQLPYANSNLATGASFVLGRQNKNLFITGLGINYTF